MGDVQSQVAKQTVLASGPHMMMHVLLLCLNSTPGPGLSSLVAGERVPPRIHPEALLPPLMGFFNNRTIAGAD
jgi:hypothetical protein